MTTRTDYGQGTEHDPFPQYTTPEEVGDAGGAQLKSEKDQPDGYAGLNASSKIAFAELPTGLEANQLAIGTTLGIAKDYADTKDGVHVAAADPHTGYQKESEKGAASGYASLDSGGKLDTTQLPSLSLTDTFVVGSQAAMLALTAQPGDVAVRTDLNESFILTAAPASTLGNWQLLLSAAERAASSSTPAAIGTAAIGVGTTDARADHVHAGAAGAVTFTPTGTIAATNVQTAIAEVAAEAGGVVVTTGRYFPEDYAGANDSVKIQAAADAATADDGLLVLQPGKTYTIPSGVTFLCDVDGRASTFSWTGGTSGVCISVGDGTTTRTQYLQVQLPDIINPTPAYTGTDIGLRVWSLTNSTIRMGKVSGFTIGFLSVGGASVQAGAHYGSVGDNSYYFNFIQAAIPILIQGGLAWNNECNYYGGQAKAAHSATQAPIELRYTPIPPVVVTANTDSTASQVDAGTHRYQFTYVDGNGNESGTVYAAVFGYTGLVTNDGTHTSNAITVPALSAFNMVGLPDAVSINLYRTKANAGVSHTNLFLVAEGLTPSSTYTDIIPDASLPATHMRGPQISWGKPDSHKFWGVNVEGSIPDYAVICEGSYNLFDSFRYELIGGPYFHGAGAYRNTVRGGALSQNIALTQDLGAFDNVLQPIGAVGPADGVSLFPTQLLASTDVQAAFEEIGGLSASTLVGVSLATGTATASPIVTSSISPSTSVVFVFVSNSNAAGAPTVSGVTGLGGTWVEVESVAILANVQRLALWMGTGCSGSGTLSIATSGVATNGRYSILEFTGIDTTDPIVEANVQSVASGSTATSAGVTPDRLVSSANAFLTGVHHGQTEDVSPLASATEINDTNSASAAGMETNYLLGRSTSALGGSWSTTTIQYALIGVEVNAHITGTTSPFVLADFAGGTPAPVLSTTNAAGNATTFLRTNDQLALFDATSPAAVGTAATGSAALAARRDHVHATGAGTPSTQAFGDSASTGSGPAAAMTDHKHAMPSERAASSTTPSAVGTAAVGTGTTDAKGDHVHATGAGTPTTQAFGDAAATGSGPAASMTDHKHAMPSERVAASTTPAAVGTGAVGTGTTDARSDHVHATGAGTPTTQAFSDSAATGSGPAAAMTDHKHAWPSSPLGLPLALTGATSATRYVGATASGAPVSGTFAVGDLAIDQAGQLWVCITAGSPGTWISPQPTDPTYLPSYHGYSAWNGNPLYTGVSSALSTTAVYSAKVWCPVAFTASTIDMIINIAGASLTAAVSTTVAAGSTGQNVNALTSTTLNVASTTGFSAVNPSYIRVATTSPAGTAILKYTGTSGGNAFTGITTVSGTGTVSTGNAVNQSFNQAALYSSDGTTATMIGFAGDLFGTWTGTGTKAGTLTAVQGQSLAITAGSYIYVFFICSGSTTITPKAFSQGTLTVSAPNIGLTGANMPFGRVIAAATGNVLPDQFTLSSMSATTSFTPFWAVN